MIEQLSKTKAWAEFVEWMENLGTQYRKEYGFVKVPKGLTCNEADVRVSDRELLSLLVEFCDSKEYYISIRYFPLSNRFDSVVNDMHIKGTLDIAHIPMVGARTEATQQAVVKCFELMSN